MNKWIIEFVIVILVAGIASACFSYFFMNWSPQVWFLWLILLTSYQEVLQIKYKYKGEIPRLKMEIRKLKRRK